MIYKGEKKREEAKQAWAGPCQAQSHPTPFKPGPRPRADQSNQNPLSQAAVTSPPGAGRSVSSARRFLLAAVARHCSPQCASAVGTPPPNLRGRHIPFHHPPSSGCVHFPRLPPPHPARSRLITSERPIGKLRCSGCLLKVTDPLAVHPCIPRLAVVDVEYQCDLWFGSLFGLH